MKMNLRLLLSLLTLGAWLNASETEIAWDCHQVLVTSKKGAMLKIGFLEGIPAVTRVVGALCSESLAYCWHRKPGKTHQLVSEIVKKLRIKKVTVEDFKGLLDEYNPALWALILKMATQQKPIPGMQEIIQELHQAGYKQRAATNMSTLEFAAVRAENPALFEHFEEDNFTIEADPDFPRKPDVDYFHRYHKRFNPDGQKKVIFIDDKKKNTHSSEQAGMVAIHFKNAQQLRAELVKLGIL